MAEAGTEVLEKFLRDDIANNKLEADKRIADYQQENNIDPGEIARQKLKGLINTSKVFKQEEY